MAVRFSAITRKIARRLEGLWREAMESSKDVGAHLLMRARALAARFRKPDTSTFSPRMLVIDELVSDPRFGAGYPRAEQLLEAIVRAGWSVTFFPMIASANDVEWMRGRFAGKLEVQRGNGARALARYIRINVGRFDAVLVSRPDTAMTFNAITTAVPTFLHDVDYIYDAEALIAPRERMRRALFDLPFSTAEYEDTLNFELALLKRADAVISVSPVDAQILASSTDASIFVIPHRIASRPGATRFADRRDLLFIGRLTGTRHESPNVDSLVWFVEEVMPRLDELMGTAYRVRAAGVIDSPQVEALRSKRVVLHGVVEDLSTLYDECRVFIAPTRFAAGISIKVLEAFGSGLPCVVTPVLANQLGVIDEGAVMVGRDAASFAEGCHRLHTDAVLWQHVRDSALATIASNYSAAMFDRSVVDVLGGARRRHDGSGVDSA